MATPGFTNTVEWLISQIRVSSTHVDYLKTGHAAAGVTFSGEPALVRELMDRFAELSENGQIERAHKPQTVDLVASVQRAG